jgi:uncharacterized protein (UPF0261 family)
MSSDRILAGGEVPMPQMPCILLLGTCDTKLYELLYVKEQLEKEGDVTVMVVDVGRTPTTNSAVDFPSSKLLCQLSLNERQSLDIEPLSRGEVIKVMIKAGTILVKQCYNIEPSMASSPLEDQAAHRLLQVS